MSKAEKLTLFETRGSARECGEQYGREYRLLIEGFYTQELKILKLLRPNEKKYWATIKEFAPHSAAFISGMSERTSLSVYDLTLLALHEEATHADLDSSGHCSAIAVSGARTKNGGSLIAQNWDWQTNMFVWPSILRRKITGTLATLTYNYPGLPSCCGINEAGLALMWTGSGYYPSVRPAMGLPSYVLIDEILRKRSVKQALSFLKSVPQAGCFIFVIGDSSGCAVVVEGVNNRIEVVRADPLLYRANLYGCAPAIKWSKQHRRLNPRKVHSLKRLAKFRSLTRTLPLPISCSFLKSALSTPPILVDLRPAKITVDTLIADADRRTLHYRRAGGRAWHSLSVL